MQNQGLQLFIWNSVVNETEQLFTQSGQFVQLLKQPALSLIIDFLEIMLSIGSRYLDSCRVLLTIQILSIPKLSAK